jgi:RNA-directed DNA polymerase
LANVTLNGLERGLSAHLGAKFGTTKAGKLKVKLVRYADDFVITGDSREVLETEVRPWVEAFLAARGLPEEKTRITHIDDGFDFLGWNFRKYSGKLLTKPSKKNAQAFYRKVAETISGNKTVKQGDLIRLLNPMLRGWAQYHRPVTAKKAYSRMEHLIFQRLWRWSKRRHPQKSAGWVKKKYFHEVGTRRWVFAVREKHDDGKWGLTRLYQLSGTVIKRHTKIKGDYNPFDLEWEQYGEQLRQERMEDSMRHRKQWVTLFMSQRGLCAHCGGALTDVTGWHDHHLEYRMHGGSDALSNRVLLHPHCHHQVHVGKLVVTKPALS